MADGNGTTFQQNKGIIVLSHGVDAIDSENVIPESNYILTVGRLEKVKGITLLIDAMVMVKEQFPETKLIIIGEGGERGELEKQVEELGLTDRVMFNGILSNGEVRAWMKNARCFVLPTYSESFGMVFLEAMYEGTPVIGTEVGGVPELVVNGETGFIVPPGDPEKLGDSICVILGDMKLRDRMSLNAKERAKEFSWDSVVSQLESIYESTLRT